MVAHENAVNRSLFVNYSPDCISAAFECNRLHLPINAVKGDRRQSGLFDDLNGGMISEHAQIQRTVVAWIGFQSVVAPRHVIESLQISCAVENFGRFH